MSDTKKPDRKEVKELRSIADNILKNLPVSPSQADKLLNFTIEESENKLNKFLLKIALPASVIFGMSQAAMPEMYEGIVAQLPAWTNLSTNILAAVDYTWSLIGDPIEKNNIIYHVPNIFLYSFGIFGVKKLFDYVRRKSWLDKVYEAKEMLEKNTEKGLQNYTLQPNHSILFVGRGDFIGEQFCVNSAIDHVLTLGSARPQYTNHWYRYDITNSFSVLEKALVHADAESAGEYILFPVKDTELFLPGEREYDISPEKVEVLIHSLREVEEVNGWSPKRIVIVGDRKQMTPVRTETKKDVLEDSVENISLTSIDKEIRKVTIIDASDLVIKEILRRFPDRKIMLRTSVEGSVTYKKRFFDRLEEFGYNDDATYTETVIIGYDMHEEQVQRTSFRTKMEKYLPVILSKHTHDALVRKGYNSSQFIYVPDLVLAELVKIAEQN